MTLREVQEQLDKTHIPLMLMLDGNILIAYKGDCHNMVWCMKTNRTTFLDRLNPYTEVIHMEFKDGSFVGTLAEVSDDCKMTFSYVGETDNG